MEGWLLGKALVDGDCDGIEEGADDVDGMAVGWLDGEVETDGASLSCSVGFNDTDG